MKFVNDFFLDQIYLIHYNDKIQIHMHQGNEAQTKNIKICLTHKNHSIGSI